MARRVDQLRPVKIDTDFLKRVDGCALIDMGRTRVLCTASVVEGLPEWRAGGGAGWVTAEYGMLPASVAERKRRTATDGRSKEIQRLVGRSLRAAVDLGKLGERTIFVDCDVLEADGGTRTASVTGGFVALAIAAARLVSRGVIQADPITQAVAAVSVGKCGRSARLDLDYELDRRADVDMNVVMTADGRFVEIQGAAEKSPFDRRDLDRMLKLAEGGIRKLFQYQAKAVGKAAPEKGGQS